MAYTSPDQASPRSSRSLKNSAIAHRRWALEPDHTAATQPMRDGFLAKLADEVREKTGIKDEAEIMRRAEALRRSHMQLIAAKSAEVRRQQAETRRKEAEIAAMSAELDASGLADCGSDGIDAD